MHGGSHTVSVMFPPGKRLYAKPIIQTAALFFHR